MSRVSLKTGWFSLGTLAGKEASISSAIGTVHSRLRSCFDLLLASLQRLLNCFFKGVLPCFWFHFPQQIVADLPQENHPLFNYFRDIATTGSMITVVVATEVSKLSVGKDTFIAGKSVAVMGEPTSRDGLPETLMP